MMSTHLEATTVLEKYIEKHMGRRIGPYQLARPLGQGGSGHVFLGTHVQSGQHVALKIVRHPGSDAALKQLWNEARILSRLQQYRHHPDIVRMLDFMNEGPLSVLVMELAPHGTMRDRYPHGTRLTLPAIAYYARQVAAALQYTHTFGYIHRDVKPENLLLTRNGHVLLSDFGIATTANYAALTRDRMGTALYTAPEQALGMPCYASDQYSLAVVVYEWFCGHTPFVGSTREVLLQHHSVKPSSLVSQGRSVPLAVEQVMQIALSKDPADRFGSVQLFVQALLWAMRQPMCPAPISPQRQQVPPPSVASQCGPHTERTIFSRPITQAWV
jgi:serine/threonine-protein kinase